MRIGLDLDGVIVDSVWRWGEVLNRYAGTRFGPEDLPDTHGTPEMAAISDRYIVEMTIGAGPVAGAAEALRLLRDEGHSLVVVTARTPRLRKLTEAWLEYHEMPVDRLHFLEGADKAPVVQAEGVDLMVEDTPRHAVGMATAGVEVLLFSAPYNRHVEHPLVRPCAGWSEVVRAIQSRSQRPAG